MTRPMHLYDSALWSATTLPGLKSPCRREKSTGGGAEDGRGETGEGVGREEEPRRVTWSVRVRAMESPLDMDLRMFEYATTQWSDMRPLN